MKKKLLSLTLSTILFLILNGCDPSLPPPPVGDLCVPDIATNDAGCVPINKKQFLPVKYTRAADGSFRKPVADLDDNICADAASWKNIQVYINTLQRAAKGTKGNNLQSKPQSINIE